MGESDQEPADPSLNSRTYVSHLRRSGDLGDLQLPSHIVLRLGAGPSRRRLRRGPRQISTPFGSLSPRRGSDVAVLSTSMVGAPSMAVLVECLAELGVSMMLVVGRAGSLDGDLPIGSRVVISRADGDDGASRAYGRAGVAEADPGLSQQLMAALGGTELGSSWSTDVPFRVNRERLEMARGTGGVIEMEATTLFTVGRLRDIRVGLGVVVSDLRSVSGWRAGDGSAVLASVDELVEASLSVLESTER